MERLRQLVATDGNGFRLSEPFSARPVCYRLPPVATTGLHKGSILCSLLRQQSSSRRRCPSSLGPFSLREGSNLVPLRSKVRSGERTLTHRRAHSLAACASAEGVWRP